MHDVIVVGGSLAGLSAAMQLARARRAVLVIDAERPRNRFAHASHGFLGQDGRAPGAILEDARAQLLAYPTVRLVSDEATAAREVDDGFEVTTAGASHRARRLVLATGVVDELPDVPGVEERWGTTVLHCPYCHGYEVAGRRLGVLATGEGSIRQAFLLPDWSEDVTLFTTGLVALDEGARQGLASRGVRVEEETVREIVGQGSDIRAVRLTSGREVPVEAVFIQPRTRLMSTLADQLGCAMEDGPMGPVIRTDAKKETTVPGVFAAGDAARPGHNASWASADGVMAGISAHQSLALAGTPLVQR